MNILNFKGIKLNDTQELIAVGPAVSKNYWNKSANKILNYSIRMDKLPQDTNIGYERDKGDAIGSMVNILLDPKDFITNGIRNIPSTIRGAHNADNETYKKY